MASGSARRAASAGQETARGRAQRGCGWLQRGRLQSQARRRTRLLLVGLKAQHATSQSAGGRAAISPPLPCLTRVAAQVVEPHRGGQPQVVHDHLLGLWWWAGGAAQQQSGRQWAGWSARTHALAAGAQQGPLHQRCRGATCRISQVLLCQQAAAPPALPTCVLALMSAMFSRRQKERWNAGWVAMKVVRPGGAARRGGAGTSRQSSADQPAMRAPHGRPRQPQAQQPLPAHRCSSPRWPGRP